MRDNPWYGSEASLEWDVNDTVVLRWRVPAVARPPRPGGERLGENLVTSVLDHHRSRDIVGAKHCMWGNGDEMSERELEQISELFLSSEAQTIVKLDVSDIIMVDNFRFAHGRLPYDDKRRSHMALFSAKVDRGVNLPALGSSEL